MQHMTWKQNIVRLLRKFGYDLTRYRPARHPEARRMRLMQTYGINVVLDVGANAGQYGTGLRSNGYKDRIISFEPLGSAYTELERICSPDPLWECHKMALGDKRRSQKINVSANSTSSSLLEMLPAHTNAAPQSKYIGNEMIQVETLDNLLPGLECNNKNIWLKIDTQGYEKQVIYGASICINNIDTVQMEVSLIPLYDGSADFRDLIQTMDGFGYSIVAIDPGFSDNLTGRLLQADFTFHRYPTHNPS